MTAHLTWLYLVQQTIHLVDWFSHNLLLENHYHYKLPCARPPKVAPASKRIHHQ